jgi:hypothetical protein
MLILLLKKEKEGGEKMASKKDLIIAVLITFCLTATLFTIIPTRSEQGSSYDPWKDLNDDGVVDSTDLGMLGTSWATTGNPTKNVNVTQWEPAYKVLHIVANLSWGPNYLGWTWVPDFAFPTFVGGYSKMFIYMEPIYPNGTVGNYNVTHSLAGCGWYPSVYQTGRGEAYRGESLPHSASNITVEVIDGQWGYYFPTIDENACIEIKAPYVTLGFSSNSTISSGWMLMDVYIYLRTE